MWNQTYCTANDDMEVGVRKGFRHNEFFVPRFLVNYHNVEMWGILSDKKLLLYCSVPEWWKGK